MNKFMTRVELHQATWNDYEALHNQMQAQGFSRTIVGDTGLVFNLPPAEYFYTGIITVQNVLLKARTAAAMTQKKHSILVSEYVNAAWENLPLATASAAKTLLG